MKNTTVRMCLRREREEPETAAALVAALGLTHERWTASNLQHPGVSFRPKQLHCQRDYNHQRPFSSLNYQTPSEFAASCDSNIVASRAFGPSAFELTPEGEEEIAMNLEPALA